MLLPTLFFAGLSLCVFTGLFCWGAAKAIKVSQTTQPPPDEKATWNQIKAALIDLYSRYESRESARQKALRSWAGTLTICAGLCMIGILLEVRYNQLISVKSIVGGLVGNQDLAQPVKEVSKPHPHDALHSAMQKKMSLPLQKTQSESQNRTSKKMN
jgi:hypothetical protein